jgi:hypothetical protein
MRIDSGWGMTVCVRAGFGPSGFLLIGALATWPVLLPDAASAVPLAYYEFSASAWLNLTGVRAITGEPVGSGAVRPGGESLGGENYQEYFAQDADGNEVDPGGIVDAEYSSGSLFDARYYASAFSIFFDINESFWFENVSDSPVYAALHLERDASAEAFSTVDTATSEAKAQNHGAYELYVLTSDPDGYVPIEDRLSSQAIDALTSYFEVQASSGGETSVSRSLLHDFEILLNPGDTFYAEYFFLPMSGSLENIPAPPVAPVPLPAGAPLLLAALGGLAFSRTRRLPAR